jgi:putative cell wall-binding protein
MAVKQRGRSLPGIISPGIISPGIAGLVVAGILTISSVTTSAAGPATPPEITPASITPANSAITSRIAGSDRFSTAAQIADRRFLGAFEAIIVNGRSFPDGLVASSWSFGLYPILLVNTDNVPTATRTRLASMSNLINVRVIGGPGVISDATLAEIANIAKVANPTAVTERVAGTNRYQTAIAVANMVANTGIPAPLHRVILAVGTDFPDALAAGALAAGHGYPMLLTNGDTLRRDVRDWLINRPDLTEVLVVGGPGVIPDAVLAEISALRNRSGASITARRLAGPNRFSTATTIATDVISRSASAPNAPGRVVIVNGRDFPDALAAGPLAGELGVPVLLTEPDRLPGATRDWLITHAGTIFEVAIIGGETAVSAAVAEQIRSAATR